MGLRPRTTGWLSLWLLAGSAALLILVLGCIVNAHDEPHNVENRPHFVRTPSRATLPPRTALNHTTHGRSTLRLRSRLLDVHDEKHAENHLQQPLLRELRLDPLLDPLHELRERRADPRAAIPEDTAAQFSRGALHRRLHARGMTVDERELAACHHHNPLSCWYTNDCEDPSGDIRRLIAQGRRPRALRSSRPRRQQQRQQQHHQHTPEPPRRFTKRHRSLDMCPCFIVC